MRWKNLGPKDLQLPSGKTIKAGATFTKKQADGVNLRALERGRVVEAVIEDELTDSTNDTKKTKKKS